jgi:hypothetical protein
MGRCGFAPVSTHLGMRSSYYLKRLLPSKVVNPAEPWLSFQPLAITALVAVTVIVFAWIAFRRPVSQPTVNDEMVRRVEAGLAQCCPSGPGTVSTAASPQPRAFGLNLYEAGLVGAFIFLVFGVGFFAIGYIGEGRPGYRRAGGAMLALSGLLTATGTKLLPLDKLFNVEKLLGADSLLSVNFARRVEESSQTTSTQTRLFHVDETVEGFVTGEAKLPPHEAIDRMGGTPVLTIIIGRADRRELRGELVAQHGSNWRLARRRAEAVAKLFNTGDVFIGTDLPRIWDGAATDDHLKPDRAVEIRAYFVAH